MSTRLSGTSSVKTFGSLRDSAQESDLRTLRSRGDSGTEHSLAVETSHHSYPKTPGHMPVAYGQYTEMQPSHQEAQRQLGHYPTQPLTHALPGGTAASSPFVGHSTAAGFPIQYQSGVITPLPYNASNPFPVGYTARIPQHPYSTSGPVYLPVNYNQRANTTGSIVQPPPQQVNLTPASTSYSMPFDQQQQQQQQQYQQHPHMLVHSKSNPEAEDDCFNIFWLFFLLGPLTWPCGFFGVCSEKHSERLAGIVSGICLILVVIAAVIVITQAPSSSNGDEN